MDDNATNRWLMQDTFRYFNIPCESSRQRQGSADDDGTDKGNGRTSDLIITDHHMPEMDGMQLVKELQQQTSGITQPTILMLSSLEKNLFQHEADKLGIRQLLTKPVKMYELYAMLSAMFMPGHESSKPDMSVTNESILLKRPPLW